MRNVGRAGDDKLGVMRSFIKDLVLSRLPSDGIKGKSVHTKQLVVQQDSQVRR